MTLIVDPDDLIDPTQIAIDTTGKTVQLIVSPPLSTDGVTIKCVYSKLKELWKSNATYIKFPFPMSPITDEQFEMVNEWNWKDNTTRYLLRTGGWALKDASGISQEEWTGIVSLGSLGATDQAYFLQSTGGNVENFQLPGAVNQAIKVYGDATHGNFDYRSYLKVYCRIFEKIYAFSQLSEIGVNTLSYQAYRFPLANAADVKITHIDANIIGNTPYFDTATHTDTDGSVTSGTPSFISVGTFISGDIGKYVCNDSGSNMGFYKVITYNSSDSVDVERNFAATESNMVYSLNPPGIQTTWYTSSQQRNIGGTNRDFNVIIDGNQATAEQCYEFIQYQLRQNNDIDNGVGTQTGKKTGTILKFVGDTLYTQLVTEGGVFIDDYQNADINRLVFTDSSGDQYTFPYTAVLTLNFGDNLVNDSNAKYWAYFTTTPEGNYGTTSAVIVQDFSSSNITNYVSGNPSIQHTFAYDTNVQGGRTSGTDAAITVVAIGLPTAQFVKAAGTIAKSVANVVSLVAPLERNYANP